MVFSRCAYSIVEVIRCRGACNWGSDASLHYPVLSKVSLRALQQVYFAFRRTQELLIKSYVV